jgi:hypothetical protein
MPKRTEIDHGNPFEAFRRLVYLHNVQQLAPQMGLKPGTLYNKADADAESHNQPTLRDVVQLTRLTGDTRVLDALCEMFDRAAFDVTPHAQASDDALLELIARMGVESGEFHAAVLQALVSHKFTVADLQAIRAEAFDLVGALMTLVQRVEGLLDE